MIAQRYLSQLIVITIIPLFFSCLGSGTLNQSSTGVGPVVIEISPKDGDTDVVRNAIITAQFDRDLDSSTIESPAAAFQIDDGETTLDATVTYSNKVAVLTPTDPLPAGSTLHVQISRTVEDDQGNAMGENFSWEFTTGSTFDMTAPVFAGIESATNNNNGTATLHWSAATDDISSSSQIQYLIYDSSDLDTILGTAIGVTSFTTSPTAPGNYEWTVRARDSAGNIDTNTATADATITVPASSFDDDVQPILTASCTSSSCHDGSSPPKGLDLRSGVAYDNIVNVSSDEIPSLLLVKPGDSSKSYLYMKVSGASGISGSRMPKSGSALNSSQLAAIRYWILNGAQDN
jgi:hypothetical protein